MLKHGRSFFKELSMHCLKQSLAVVFLAVIIILSPHAVQAMEIFRFDLMADEDQDEYVVDLVVGTERLLRANGTGALATQMHKLFFDILPGDKISLGMGEFEINLARARVADLAWARLEDLKNIEKDPTSLRIEVEDALAVTLEPNGIELPDSLYSVMKDFRPKSPPNKP
jgi:hypothetical protein